MINIIGYLTVYFIEALVSLFYFDSKFSRKVNIPLLFVSFSVFYVTSFIISQLGVSILNLITFIIGNFLILFFNYKTNIKSCIFNSALLAALMIVTELLVSYSLFAIIPMDILDGSNWSKSVFIFYSTMSKLLYFISVYIISKISVKEKSETNLNTILLLSFFPLGTVITMLASSFIYGNYNLTDTLRILLIISNIIMLLSNMIVFYVHEQTIKANKTNTELLLTQQKEENTSDYYNLLKQQNENSKVLIHDITKHLNSIKMLSSNENIDINSYINYIIDDFNIINPVDYCSNALLNLITYRYSATCKNENIKFDINIQNAKLDFMNEPDITALFDNLLENAIEAAKQADEKSIDFSIDIRNTNFLVVCVTNSSNKKPLVVNGNIITSKKDSDLHGIGMKSIKRVVKKYDGNINTCYDEKDKTFTSTIIFRIPSTDNL